MGRRPSELYGIQDRLVAFYFDRAITRYGAHVDSVIQVQVRDAKPKTDKAARALAERIYDKYRFAGSETKPASRYADPAKM